MGAKTSSSEAQTGSRPASPKVRLTVHAGACVSDKHEFVVGCLDVDLATPLEQLEPIIRKQLVLDPERHSLGGTAPLSPALASLPLSVANHTEPRHDTPGCGWRYHPQLVFLDPMRQTNDYYVDPVTGEASIHGHGRHTVDLKKPLSDLRFRMDKKEDVHLWYKRHFVCRDPSPEDVPVIEQAAAEIAQEKRRRLEWSRWQFGVLPKDVIGTFQGGWEGRTTYPVYGWTPQKAVLLAKSNPVTAADSTS